MAFTWSPDGNMTLVCDDIVHRLDRNHRERSAFLLEKGEPVIDIAHGTRGGPFWIARADGTVLTLNMRLAPRARSLSRAVDPEVA